MAREDDGGKKKVGRGTTDTLPPFPPPHITDALLQAAEMYDVVDEGGDLLAALEERFPIKRASSVQLDTELSFANDPFLSGGFARDISI